MNRLKTIRGFLMLVMLGFFLSSCYTQFAVVERQKVKRVIVEEEAGGIVESEAIYEEDIDTVYYDEVEAPVTIHEYNVYEYPELYRFHYGVYDPWWYYSDPYYDYYYGGYWGYGYYPHWYRHHYPYVVVYDPYYYNDYYYGGYYYDHHYGKDFKPRPFNRRGSSLVDSRSSRISVRSSSERDNSDYRANRVSGSVLRTNDSRSSSRRSSRISKPTSGDDFKATRVDRTGNTETKVTRTSGKSEKDRKVINSRRNSSKKIYYRTSPSSRSNSKKVVRIKRSSDTKSRSSGSRGKSSSVKKSSGSSSKSSSVRSTKRSSSSRRSSSVTRSRSSSSSRSSSTSVRSSSGSSRSSSAGSSRSSSRSSRSGGSKRR